MCHKCSIAHVATGYHIARQKIPPLGHPPRHAAQAWVRTRPTNLQQHWKDNCYRLKVKLLENRTFSHQKTNERKWFISYVPLYNNHQCTKYAGLFTSKGQEINDLKLINPHIQKVQTARDCSKPMGPIGILVGCPVLIDFNRIPHKYSPTWILSTPHHHHHHPL